MRYATIVFGGPDFILANLAVAQMAKFYGVNVKTKAFNTMGKLPDDAQAELTAGTVIVMALAGMKILDGQEHAALIRLLLLKR